MSKQWSVPCKMCGEVFEYSDIVTQKAQQTYGHSSPEYCDDCRKKRRKIKGSLGLPYFHRSPRIITNNNGCAQGVGSVFHPERNHIATAIKSEFDINKFGVTKEQIKTVFEWFETPEHQVAILIAGTGAGKSTALPISLALEVSHGRPDLFTKQGSIVITQPRIEAVDGVSHYVARTVGGKVGKNQEIGARHSRSRDTASFSNVLLYATEGSVLNFLKNGQMAQIGTLIIDEAHERSVNIDIILRLVKRRLQQFPYLKVIIMSATIDEIAFRDFFGAHTATIIHLSGEERKCNIFQSFADEKDVLPYDNLLQLSRQIVPMAIKKTKELFVDMSKGRVHSGYVLVFLHSISAIEQAVNELTTFFEQSDFFAGKAIALPFHSKLSKKACKLAEYDVPGKKYKVVFGTNMAETSLTIDGLMHVIDTGIINQSQHDTRTQLKNIVPVLHSRSGCKQRWGRVGRTQDGYVKCLYTEEQFDELFPEHIVPEIQRVGLQSVSLALRSAGINSIQGDDWLATPNEEEAKYADNALSHQGFVDKSGDITTQGDTLMRFMDAMDVAPLITASMRYGCAIEMASVLPVLCPDGNRKLFLWDKNWDIYRKYEVAWIHNHFFVDCVDDVDCVLRIMAIFDCIPEKEQRRKFADIFGFNYDVIKDVIKSRNEILAKMQVGMRDLDLDGVRNINFAFADAVRIIFTYYFPVYRECQVKSDSYHFEMKRNINDGEYGKSNIMCKQEWLIHLDAVDKLNNPSILFAQIVAKVKKKINVNTVQIAEDFVEQFVKGSKFESIYRQLMQNAYPTSSVCQNAEILFQKGKTYEFQTITSIQSPYDFESMVLVQHTDRIKPLVVSSNNLSFSPAGSFVQSQFNQSGQCIMMTATDVSNSFRPNFSIFPVVEKILHKKFERWAKCGKSVMKKGTIVNIRDNGYIVILLKSTSNNKNCFNVVLVHEDKYPGVADDYSVGEQCNVHMWSPANNISFVYLNKGKKEVETLIKTGRLSSALFIKGNKLSVTGWLSFAEVDRMKALLDGIVTSDLLDKLYRYSNQLSVSEIVSIDKIQNIIAKYPSGTVVDNVKVESVYPSGMRVVIDQDIFGFVHIREIYGFTQDLTQRFNSGESVNVKILSYDDQKNSFVLSMKVAGNHNPLETYKVGDMYYATVVELMDKGLKVALDEYVISFVPFHEMYGWTTDVSDVASVDQRVQVCVQSIDLNTERVLLSMKTPENNIFNQFSIGSTHTGTIVKIESFGLRVQIHKRITGLVHYSQIYTKSVKGFCIGQEVEVVIKAVDMEKNRVELHMLLPKYNSWHQIHEGDVVDGIVTGVKKYGWFVELTNGISGLVHINSMDQYVKDVTDIANIDDKVQVQIIEIVDNKLKLSFE